MVSCRRFRLAPSLARSTRREWMRTTRSTTTCSSPSTSMRWGLPRRGSASITVIAAPDIFVAATAMRTKQIKLGMGVLSLPNHHPFQVADRVVMLDHLTRGQVILGAGPGQLSDDSKMMRIDPLKNRRKMDESFGIIYRLLHGLAAVVGSNKSGGCRVVGQP